MIYIIISRNGILEKLKKVVTSCVPMDIIITAKQKMQKVKITLDGDVKTMAQQNVQVPVFIYLKNSVYFFNSTGISFFFIILNKNLF
jgi:hypothetical protein